MMRSQGGRALLALRENPRVASTFGINVRLATLFAFVVSGAFAGLAGALIASNDTFVSPEVWNFNLALVFVIMTVVGGLRSRAGVVIGGAFFALLPYLIEQDPGSRGRAREDPGAQRPHAGARAARDRPAAPAAHPDKFPGGIGQQIRPLQALAGRTPLRPPRPQGPKEVQITDVRA